MKPHTLSLESHQPLASQEPNPNLPPPTTVM